MDRSPRSDIIVVGASAGGLDVLKTIVRGLPADFSAAVFVVVHIAPDQSSSLAGILDRRSDLEVRQAVNGEPVRHGTALVAPPDHHLVFADSTIRLERGPKVNAHRPSIDVTFRSAAEHFGSRVIGVVLSGGLDDGTDGLRIIKRFGGCAVVQDPLDAEFDSMPRSAIEHVDVDRVLAADKIAAALIEIASDLRDAEVKADMGLASTEPDRPSQYVCPECNGTLFESDQAGWSTFKCRVGHAYTEESLVLNKGIALETALWTAARTLREQADLFDRLSSRAGPHNDALRMRFEGRAAAVREHLKVIEEAVHGLQNGLLADGSESGK